MARSLKTRGLAELESLRRRVRRQHSLKRISKVDADWIEQQLNEIEARIIAMWELNEEGEEES